jgi:hypothetical protein
VDIDYADGSLLAFWYDSWIVLVGFGVALLLAVIVLARASWNQGGLVLKTVMVVAVLAVLPLTLIRVGLKLAITNFEAPGYLSLAGTAVALVVGISYMLRDWRRLRQPATDGGFEPTTPTQDLTQQTGVGGTLSGAETIMGGRAAVPGTETQTVAPAAWLHFTSGSMAGQSIPLQPDVTSIGRADDNDLVIEDETVSRLHAQITIAPRHRDVHEDQVGLKLTSAGYGLVPVARLTHNIQTPRTEQTCESGSEEGVVIDKKNPHS